MSHNIPASSCYRYDNSKEEVNKGGPDGGPPWSERCSHLCKLLPEGMFVSSEESFQIFSDAILAVINASGKSYNTV